MDTITSRARALSARLILWRRFFHRHAEVGWTEYVTSAYLADTLTKLGYEVHMGREIVRSDARYSLPDTDALLSAEKRARAFGADDAMLASLSGGHTGLCATFRTGRKGKTICLRFDIDANDLTEATDETHRPTREGFASRYEGAMHACGHDGHMAIALGIATILAEHQERLTGTVMLLFQPAEEGVRGAFGIAASGFLDAVDELWGLHLGFALTETGLVGASATDFLATVKLDATFQGVSAHAGANPDGGKNALLAAATAALSLHALPRRASGMSRINVGTLCAGEGRNTIPARGAMSLEVRGETSAIADDMAKDARRTLSASAAMYDVTVHTAIAGRAAAFSADRDLAAKSAALASSLGIFDQVLPVVSFGASEDFATLAERVQSHGGKANYLILGTRLTSGHHSDRFDFDEDALWRGTALLSALVLTD